jgi:Protein of unknown function (DUF2950)
VVKDVTRIAIAKTARDVIALACASVAVAAAVSCTSPAPGPRTFGTPEDAVRTLTEVVKAEKLDDLLAIFGPDGQELVASSDPVTGRRNRRVFTIAVAEGWKLIDQGSDRKVLVIGNEEWPFPIPLVRDANGWRFDTAAGKEEVIARRIGRNELAVIQICRTYVTAQRLYARHGHDGKPAGLYATAFRSDTGKQNGLYWPAGRGQKRSPLGDLVAQAAEEGRTASADRQPSPFHGYYFKILTGQGAAAAGGAKDYVAGGHMSGGFALVAWPAQYDVTGVMTFIVNQHGVLHQKDLGSGTDANARAMALYDPDSSWGKVE